MLNLHDGQCGLCKHFGEHHPTDTQLIQIRTTKQAPESLVDDCGLPKMEGLHLKVSPVSSCDGYEPAAA